MVTCKIAQLLFNYLSKWETIIRRAGRRLNKCLNSNWQKFLLLSSAFSRAFCVLWDETAGRNEHLSFCAAHSSGISRAWNLSQTIQTFFQTTDTESYFQLSKALPFACWDFLLSYPFSHQAVKGWLFVFCTSQHQPVHTGMKSPTYCRDKSFIVTFSNLNAPNLPCLLDFPSLWPGSFLPPTFQIPGKWPGWKLAVLRYGIPTDSKVLTCARMCKWAERCECLRINHNAKKKKKFKN